MNSLLLLITHNLLILQLVRCSRCAACAVCEHKISTISLLVRTSFPGAPEQIVAAVKQGVRRRWRKAERRVRQQLNPRSQNPRRGLKDPRRKEPSKSKRGSGWCCNSRQCTPLEDIRAPEQKEGTGWFLSSPVVQGRAARTRTTPSQLGHPRKQCGQRSGHI